MSDKKKKKKNKSETGKNRKEKKAVKAADLPYRPGVGVVLLNREGKVFVAKRNDVADVAWQLPQGGIDRGESPGRAALRELYEEIGTDKVVIVGRTRDWLTYDLPPALVGKAFKGRYRGQAQKWFAMRFTGTDDDIDLNRWGDPEFDSWRWVDIEDLPELIVDFKRAVYERIVEEFRHLTATRGE